MIKFYIEKAIENFMANHEPGENLIIILKAEDNRIIGKSVITNNSINFYTYLYSRNADCIEWEKDTLISNGEKFNRHLNGSHKVEILRMKSTDKGDVAGENKIEI